MVYLQNTPYVYRTRDRIRPCERIHSDTRFEHDPNGERWVERTGDSALHIKDSEAHKDKVSLSERYSRWRNLHEGHNKYV